MTTRSSRACLVCSVVLPQSKFIQNGCPNCEDFLEMRGSQDVVEDCTSEVFEGVMFLTPHAAQDSWVAKWQRLQGYQPGLYAVKVNGIVSLSFFLLPDSAIGERMAIAMLKC
jgi:transcription elongation factor SPT4